MKSLVLEQIGKLVVAERPTPEPAGGEAVIAIIATGICGSDFHGFSGENGRRSPGQVMGHETVGRVWAVGAGVDHLTRGQLVTINPLIACDDCQMCSRGAEHCCPNRKVIGVAPEIDAAFAEYLLVSSANVVPLADGIDPELGALVEPLSVGWHAAGRAGITEQERVLVIGGGPIGQAALLAAIRMGAGAVAVSDVTPSRRELCAGLGGDRQVPTIDPAAGDLAGQVERALGGPATVVIDAVGVSATVADAISASTSQARIVLVGMGSPTLEIAAYGLSAGERSLVGSYAYTRAEFAATAEWVGTNPPGLDTLIDGRVSMEQAHDAFAELAEGRSAASKILVFPAGVSQD